MTVHQIQKETEWTNLKKIETDCSCGFTCSKFMFVVCNDDTIFGRHILFDHEAVILLFKGNFSSFKKTNIWTRTELAL